MYAARFHPYAQVARAPAPFVPRKVGARPAPLAQRYPATPAVAAFPRGGYRPAPSPYARSAYPAVGQYAAPARPALPTVAKPAAVRRAPSLPTIAPTRPAVSVRQPIPVAPVPQVPEEPNPKSKLNEWFSKVGHPIHFETVPCEGGYMSTVVLPLEGAGEAASCVGFGPKKKLAETQAADQAMQTLMAYGLLDILNTPKRPKAPKAPKAQGANGLAAVTQVPPEEVAALKEPVYGLVVTYPGKRTSTYVLMCPEGETRARVSAALHQLELEGLIVKHKPEGGKTQNPFWAPVGYDGPLGGGITEDMLGAGRTLPYSQEKAVCYDVLTTNPGLTAEELHAHISALGNAWDMKTVKGALFSMKKDGTADVADEVTAAGLIRRWSLK